MFESWTPVLVIAFGALTIGLVLGAWLQSRLWREKGDHPYMNRMESGGNLYRVKRESEP